MPLSAPRTVQCQSIQKNWSNNLGINWLYIERGERHIMVTLLFFFGCSDLFPPLLLFVRVRNFVRVRDIYMRANELWKWWNEEMKTAEWDARNGGMTTSFGHFRFECMKRGGGLSIAYVRINLSECPLSELYVLALYRPVFAELRDEGWESSEFCVNRNIFTT